MIVVATSDFEVYHGVVNELRDRGVQFTTREPDDPLPDAAEVLITGNEDDWSDDPEIEIVRADAVEPRAAVERALAALRGSGRTIVGIDPGDRPGIAVFSGEMIVAAFHVPISDVAETVATEIEGTADPVVRIGDGARLKGTRIIDELPDVPIELVDETGTTPSLGTGARGMGDVLAAANIAQIAGEPIHSREVEPTPGELQAIKQRSREQSDGDRTIDKTLARRVALGELSIEQALERHRD
ncbi:hypothetical protein [Halocatena pleomorpha]|uniref:Uncharacterized protein n=1 Tax=Halocatena pleomorpha TaxID=1785090 RepID=A0A3P3R9U4_9EURY|nr:hypothetical protein [Halocatena pleomorpha]RRJ30252.1 hypothetical protein EIK79_10025 [Halocatena pleomorpha]